MKDKLRTRILLLGGLCLTASVASLAGCSSGGGSTEPTAADDASAKNNFTREATAEEKAKANNAPPK